MIEKEDLLLVSPTYMMWY